MFAEPSMQTNYSTNDLFQSSSRWVEIIKYLLYSMAELYYIFKFSGKYREFHLMYENGDFLEAAHLLISLLTSNLAPKR